MKQRTANKRAEREMRSDLALRSERERDVDQATIKEQSTKALPTNLHTATNDNSKSQGQLGQSPNRQQVRNRGANQHQAALMVAKHGMNPPSRCVRLARIAGQRGNKPHPTAAETSQSAETLFKQQAREGAIQCAIKQRERKPNNSPRQKLGVIEKSSGNM